MSAFKYCTLGIIALAVGGGYLYQYRPELLRENLPKKWCDTLHVPKIVPGSYIGKLLKGSDWADTDATQEKLRELIDSRLPGTETAQVSGFLQNPENRLIIAQYALTLQEQDAADLLKQLEKEYANTLTSLEEQRTLARNSSAQGSELPAKIRAAQAKLDRRIEALKRETTAPHALHEIVARKTGSELMERLGNNLDWMEQIVFSADATRPGIAVSILDAIARRNPDMIYNQMDRDIATAAAIEFARMNWAQDDAVARAEFYMKNRKAKKLNKTFDALPFWQRRILCGLKGSGEAFGTAGNESSGSAASLQWSLDHVHLPALKYTGACWQAGDYHMYNPYGDSIVGSDFYTAFADNYEGRFNEITHDIGAVCGGLSHYGATTAIANGVPAMTAGEPGHCSYIVRVGDEWMPAYSLSWQRGLHWQVFSGNDKYSALHMADHLYSPEQQEQTYLSNALRTLGRVYSKDEPSKAQKFFNQALRAQPINYLAWRDYATHLSRSNASAAAWKQFCTKVHEKLTPAYPEMSAELLKQHVYPQLVKVLDPQQKTQELQALLTDFWKHAENMGPDERWDKNNKGRWAVEDLCNEHLKLLGIDPAKDPRIVDFAGSVISSTIGSPHYAPVALGWVNSLMEGMSPKMQDKIMAAMIGNMGADPTALGDDTREAMLKPLILSAEKRGDLAGFQSLVKTVPAKYLEQNKSLPTFTPFHDTLVSRGGLLQLSSYGGSDNPCTHGGILEPGVGGWLHTGYEKDAWVKVTLPKQAHVTGVAIITSPGHWERLKNMVIQVSESGADNDWKDVARIDECTQKVYLIDLSATAPRAKYVRILRKGEEFFHLRGIYVYGKPAA